jgi:hypothetical protein
MARLSADLGTWSEAEAIGAPNEAYTAPIAVAADGTLAIGVPFEGRWTSGRRTYVAVGGNVIVTVLGP